MRHRIIFLACLIPFFSQLPAHEDLNSTIRRLSAELSKAPTADLYCQRGLEYRAARERIHAMDDFRAKAARKQASFSPTSTLPQVNTRKLSPMSSRDLSEKITPIFSTLTLIPRKLLTFLNPVIKIQTVSYLEMPGLTHSLLRVISRPHFPS